MFYRCPTEEDALIYLKGFFNNMSENEKVIARISEDGIDGVCHDKLTHINNHLSSSSCWSEVQDWSVYVQYKIGHPEGEVLVSDNAKMTESTSVRENVVKKCDACFTNGILNISRLSVDKTEGKFNTTKYNGVNISRVKRFVYSTKRSSFVFKLEVVWKGCTKANAEASDPLYYFSLETDDHNHIVRDHNYSCVSFIEKCLDIVSLGKDQRQVFILS